MSKKASRAKVFNNKDLVTPGGLSTKDLVKSNGRIVSKVKSKIGKKNSWALAVKKARKELKIDGFAVIKKGEPIYDLAMKYYKGSVGGAAIVLAVEPGTNEDERRVRPPTGAECDAAASKKPKPAPTDLRDDGDEAEDEAAALEEIREAAAKKAAALEKIRNAENPDMVENAVDNAKTDEGVSYDELITELTNLMSTGKTQQVKDAAKDRLAIIKSEKENEEKLADEALKETDKIDG